ncbi:MAG: hypothetical protein KJZ75_15405 [Hyphomonadaceae bacterium]|nr:hypothetical protein [Hyphomonadaceae bacterium]
MTALDLVDQMIDKGGADGAFLESDLWAAFLSETGLTPTPCAIRADDVFVAYRGWELRKSGVR